MSRFKGGLSIYFSRFWRPSRCCESKRNLLLESKLRVKIKSLAEEARIIRVEERRRWSDEQRGCLTEHRRGIVRFESRHAQLLYGFLRGRKYRQLEAKAREKPDLSRLMKLWNSMRCWNCPVAVDKDALVTWLTASQ